MKYLVLGKVRVYKKKKKKEKLKKGFRMKPCFPRRFYYSYMYCYGHKLWERRISSLWNWVFESFLVIVRSTRLI